MARKPRINRPAAFYHVMLRGNNRQPIFFSDQDKCRLCLLLQQGVERFGHRIHGYCFMNNHVHLVLQTGEISISHIIQHLSFRYTRYINRKENRIGHLFQGRFKAILIDDTEYLLELVRYVHLNPVRARLVTDPKNYLWSGHRAYLGLESLLWLTQNKILREFDDHESNATNAYEQFIKRGMNEFTTQTVFTKGSQDGRLLGSDNFIQRILQEHSLIEDTPKNYSLEDLIHTVAEAMQVSVDALIIPGKQRNLAFVRGMIAFIIRNSPHLTLQELSKYVSRDLSTLSRLSYAIEQRILIDQELAEKVNQIKSKLSGYQNAITQA